MASHLQSSSNTAQNQLKSINEGGLITGAANGINSSKDLITVNKINLVASSVLAKDSSRKVEFEFGTHITFPVLKFV